MSGRGSESSNRRPPLVHWCTGSPCCDPHWEQAYHYSFYGSDKDTDSDDTVKARMVELEDDISELAFAYDPDSGVPGRFLEYLVAPLNIHHATGDKSVPYVWSDQFGRRIESLGHLEGEEVQVCHGSIAEGKFVALFGRRGQLVGAFGMDWPSMLGRYRSLLRAGTEWGDALAFAAEQEE